MRIRITVLRVVQLALLPLFVLGCHGKPKRAPAPHVFAVRVANAEERDMPIFIEGLAHVESMTNIEIRSRIEGELTGIFFKQGQEVKKGDLLFTIDPKPYQAALMQAKGALEESMANLAIAEEKLKRYKTLAKDEYYSQIDYETLQATFAANGGVVVQNRGQLDSAMVNLDYCWIYAPIDGLTGILQIDYGNLVNADDTKPLVTLNQMDPIFVTFSVPEISLPQIQKWMKKSAAPLKVQAAYESFKEEVFEGSLYMLDNLVDPNTGMIKLRGIFDNQARTLWPGQFVRTRLLLHTVEKAVVVPYSSVQMTLNGPVGFVLEEGNGDTVEQRPLKLGQRQEDTVIILEGVKAGEKIVVEGQLNLSNGSKVSIKGAR